MHDNNVDREFLGQFLDRICDGVIEGIRQEVDRRKYLGIPLVVARNGHVETVTTNGQSNDSEP